MFELLSAAFCVGLYITGAVITFLIAAFGLRGKKFSLEHTDGMHYTNEQAAETAMTYAVLWPASLLMLGYEQLIKITSRL